MLNVKIACCFYFLVHTSVQRNKIFEPKTDQIIRNSTKQPGTTFHVVLDVNKSLSINGAICKFHMRFPYQSWE